MLESAALRWFASVAMIGLYMPGSPSGMLPREWLVSCWLDSFWAGRMPGQEYLRRGLTRIAAMRREMEEAANLLWAIPDAAWPGSSRYYCHQAASGMLRLPLLAPDTLCSELIALSTKIPVPSLSKISEPPTCQARPAALTQPNAWRARVKRCWMLAQCWLWEHGPR